MAQIWDSIEPKSIRTKLENASISFFLDQRQPEGVAIKRQSLVVSVARTFDGDIRAT
jgi:hypothetical protein